MVANARSGIGVHDGHGDLGYGLTKKDAFRCLKLYIAREVYGLLPREPLTA
jgi:hypothetical protein